MREFYAFDDNDEIDPRFRARIVHETPDAYLLALLGAAENEWVPKSQILDVIPKPDDRYDFVITLWFARKRGWV